MRKCDAVAHILEHEHDTSIEYSVDPTAMRLLAWSIVFWASVAIALATVVWAIVAPQAVVKDGFYHGNIAWAFAAGDGRLFITRIRIWATPAIISMDFHHAVGHMLCVNTPWTSHGFDFGSPLPLWGHLLYYEYHYSIIAASWNPPLADSQLYVQLPFWAMPLSSCIVGLGASLPVRHWRRDRRRRQLGLCLACGYDLRAHKPGDRCPECGTVIPAETKCGNI